MARTTKISEDGKFWCNHCKQHKALEEFFKVSPSQRGNRSPHCRECSIELNYFQRHKRRLKVIGPDAYRAELVLEQKRLEERFKMLDQFKKETT